MRSVALFALAMLASTPALAGKACEFKNDDGECERRADLLSISLVKKGTPYPEMKRQLAGEGLYSYPRASSDMGRCQIHKDVCRDFPETISCTGVGGADCRFRVKVRYGTYVVDTLYRSGQQRVSGVHYLSQQNERDLEASLRD